jgi:ABC-type spermidine/putrescine transport system permease subunit II
MKKAIGCFHEEIHNFNRIAAKIKKTINIFKGNQKMLDVLSNFSSGELNISTVFLTLIIATLVAMLGGAIGGMLLAGKDIGYQLSAILGGLFGPAGVIPAVVLGLAVLNFFTNL